MSTLTLQQDRVWTGRGLSLAPSALATFEKEGATLAKELSQAAAMADEPRTSAVDWTLGLRTSRRDL